MTASSAPARHPMVPVAPPEVIPDVFTSDEVKTLFGVVTQNAPWRLVAAHHFASTEEYLAIAGPAALKPGAVLSDFVAPVFRGYLAKEGVLYHPELHDIYFSRKLLELAMSMHGAAYGFAHHMLFNLSVPSRSFDAGHFDGRNWRGMTSVNTPVWLMGVMAKSGLFDPWEVKTAQVITYFYDSDLDGGFTYWPDGPDAAPARIPAPFWNTGLLSDNSRMYHRREGNGPRDRRDLPELRLESTLHRVDDEWSVRNGDTEIRRCVDAETRSLFHYTALLFDDRADADRYLDHTDDLTASQVFDMLGDDLTRRGVEFCFPEDPLTDPEFIGLLSRTYAMAPREYPAEAPLDVR